MNILIAEDNKAEQAIVREAFNEAGVICNLNIVDDGLEATEFLNQKGKYGSAHRPDLVILDLNLPKKKGPEILAEMRNSRQYEHTPVLIFSNSESSQDICQCYTLRANAYVNKPSEYKGFVNFANLVDKFWIQTVCYCPH